MSIIASNLSKKVKAPVKAGTLKELVRVKDVILCDEWENSDDVSFTDVSATAGVLVKGKWQYFEINVVVKSEKIPADLSKVTHFYLGQFFRTVDGEKVFTTVPYDERENPDFYEDAEMQIPKEELCIPTSVQVLRLVTPAGAVTKQPAKSAPKQPNLQRKQPQSIAVEEFEEEFEEEESADEPPF